jgi:acyl-CoA synthetase (AMP-forming)/AMP-acid ligase II
MLVMPSDMPLLQSLRRATNRVVLRVVDSPGAKVIHEFTGSCLLDAETKARLQPISGESRVVLLLLPHSSDLFLLQIGLVLCGKVPAVLPWPTTRVDGAKYQHNLVHQLNQLSADHLITLPRLAQNLRPGVQFSVSECELANGEQFETMFMEHFIPESRQPRLSVGRQDLPEDALFLQFSGGTTGTQKCVVVTAAMLAEQLYRLSQALAPKESDGVVSWLPLYHDMGLIACLYFPLWTGIPSLHFAATDWLLQPELLFSYIQQYRASLCWLPNFAFSYLAQCREVMQGCYSLGHVRAWINCSEPVRRKSISDFADRFADWGVATESLQSSYAMAENVFAVTQSASGESLPAVARSQVKGTSLFYRPDAFELIDDVYVSSGRCLNGMRLRIIGADGFPCPDFVAGEIQLQTSCLLAGYWDRSGFCRDAFTEDDWYRTGDFGFLAGDDVFVIGRIKDIIIVAGQNIFPEDVEIIASRVGGVYPGRVVAFGIDNDELGTQSIGVVAEMKGEFDSVRAAEMEREIRSLIIASLGVAPRYVSVVSRHWIIKSTAGKISRRDTRNRLLEKLELRT